MKKVILFVFISFLTRGVFANPIPVPPVISEIYLSEGTIQIEFYFTDFWWYDTFDDLMLVSSTDAIAFIEGIEITMNEIIVLDNSSLQGPFNVNPDGDFIDIVETATGFSVGPGPIGFGNYIYAFIPAPGVNQSMAYEMQYNWQYGYYDYILSIEQPPSIGSDPFNVQARGCLAGYVYDLGDHPVVGAQIYDVYTNDEGYFIKTDLLCHLYYFLRIYLNGVMFWDGEDFLIQPYDTCIRYLQIDTLLTTISKNAVPVASIYNLPNPFSNNTIFHISIPDNINYKSACICIYDMTGTQVEEIEISNNPFANSWNSAGFDPGIYFYNLVIDNKSFTSQKMIKH